MNINNLSPRLQERIQNLNEQDKQKVQAAWDRHIKACAKTECGPDPMFIEEVVSELAAGRNLFVSA